MPVTGKIVVIALVALFAACQQSTEEPFAKVVSSAVIEVRDKPTQAELDKKSQVVILGTGTPLPDAQLAGSIIEVIHKGEA